MKKITGNYNLHNKDIFSLDRINSSTSLEGGASVSYGFDYIKSFNNDNKFNFSVGQIINEKKTDKNKPDTSSLDKRFSDIIGDLNLKKITFKLIINIL